MHADTQIFSLHSGYVLVERPAGYELTYQSCLEGLTEITRHCDGSGCRRVLIVGPGTDVKLSVKEIYKLGKEISKQRLKIAIFESHGVTSEEMTFLETLVTCRGLPLRFFGNQQEATTWLIENPWEVWESGK